MNINRNKKNLSSLILFLTFAIVLAGCQRGSSEDISDIGIDLTISPDPPVVGQAMITLELTNAEGNPITGANLELEGNMNHAGMVPVFSQATELGEGRYEASIQFTMGGDWFILVKANLPDGRKLERQVDVPGVETR